MQIGERGEAATEEADTRERSRFLIREGPFAPRPASGSGGRRRRWRPRRSGRRPRDARSRAYGDDKNRALPDKNMAQRREDRFEGAHLRQRNETVANGRRVKTARGAISPRRRLFQGNGRRRDVLALMKAASPQSIRWLTRTELAATKLSTDPPEEAAPASTAPPAAAAAALGGRTIATLGAKDGSAIPLMVAGSKTPPLRLGDEGRSSPIGREAGGSQARAISSPRERCCCCSCCSRLSPPRGGTSLSETFARRAAASSRFSGVAAF